MNTFSDCGFVNHVYIQLIHTFAQERARCRPGFEVISCQSEMSVQQMLYSTALKKTVLSADARPEADKLFSATQTLLGSRSDDLFGEWCIADLDLAIMLNRLILLRNLVALDVPAAEIKIILSEVPAQNWGLRGGLPASEIDLGFKVDV